MIILQDPHLHTFAGTLEEKADESNSRFSFGNILDEFDFNIISFNKWALDQTQE